MDVGRERSTWGEYLHSLTVRVSMIFNLPFSHVVSLTTPTLCEVWKSAAIHLINPTLQLVSYVRPLLLQHPPPPSQTHTAWHHQAQSAGQQIHGIRVMITAKWLVIFVLELRVRLCVYM